MCFVCSLPCVSEHLWILWVTNGKLWSNTLSVFIVLNPFLLFCFSEYFKCFVEVYKESHLDSVLNFWGAAVWLCKFESFTQFLSGLQKISILYNEQFVMFHKFEVAFHWWQLFIFNMIEVIKAFWNHLPSNNLVLWNIMKVLWWFEWQMEPYICIPQALNFCLIFFLTTSNKPLFKCLLEKKNS